MSKTFPKWLWWVLMVGCLADSFAIVIFLHLHKGLNVASQLLFLAMKLQWMYRYRND